MYEAYERDGRKFFNILSSLIVFLINWLLRAAIKFFAHYEKHWTYTRFNISYAKKLAFTQFLNTAIIPYVVNMHFS